MPDSLDPAALDQLFFDAHTMNTFRPVEVPDSLLVKLVNTLKFGPTSANCSPARFVFVKSPAAKERLKPHLSEGNRDKTMDAPVTAIVAHDMKFYDNLPKLFPHTDARSWFADKPDAIAEAAFRNGSLQGAYMILAARALGLDCGPMSGFDNAGLDREFFPEGDVKSNFLCNLGYGDPSGFRPRNPRLDFDAMSKIV